MISSVTTIIFRLTFANVVGTNLNPNGQKVSKMSKIRAIVGTLPVFAVSVAYRVTTLTTMIWVIYNIDGGQQATIFGNKISLFSIFLPLFINTFSPYFIPFISFYIPSAQIRSLIPKKIRQ